VFCAYLVVLLVNAFGDRDQLRQAAERRLIAENRRCAEALSDVAEDRIHLARHISELNELNTYLTSKALGMSPQYGLGVSLDALERRLHDYVTADKLSFDGARFQPFVRVVIFDESASVLADSAAGAAMPTGLKPGTSTAESSSIELGPDGQFLVSRVPVMFKDQFSGTLVTLTEVGEIYRRLIKLDADDNHRETVLTLDGREVVPAGQAPRFAPELAKALARLPENQTTPLSRLPWAGELGGSVAVMSTVTDMPVRLVTTQPLSGIEGTTSSTVFLYLMAVFPAILLLLAVRFNRLQSRTSELQREAMFADAQRRALQDRNELMSDDIRRREALEIELAAYRDHLEDLVKQRSAELTRLFDALPDLYFRASRDGTILECRAGRPEDLLMPVEALLGQRMQDFLPPDVASLFGQALNQLEFGADQLVLEYQLPLERGEQYFEARVLPLGTDQVVVVVRNVTDRHEIDAAREHNRLETERLGRLKSEFLMNMSHEIRTPLNAVLGLAQVGARAAPDEAAREAFKPIEVAGRHLLDIVNDILDFSKLEAGKLSIEHQVFALEPLIQWAASMVVGRAKAKDLELGVDLAGGLPEWVDGDELRVKQVLVNLLSNAVKFTERGSITLRVTHDDHGVSFSVKDTGIGISREQMKNLFKPFAQADVSTTRRFGGTGLGLSISHDLATLMGGGIEVRSQIGQGSEFILSLPLTVAERPDEAAAPEVSDGPRLRGLRVLAAEDNEVNCLVLESMLEHEGAEVVFVSNGQEAVDAMQKSDATGYHAVLMDVQMPVMDGLEATRLIEALHTGVPVIGLTAHALEEERQRCRDAGMVAHVAKPVEIDELVTVLQLCARRFQG
jgi:signal transduction histidine kinase/CheY-like chemotaxis protein